MTHKSKLYLISIMTSMMLLLSAVLFVVSTYDLSSLASNPKKFVNTNFPSFYYKLKKIALNAGGENIMAGSSLEIPQIKLKLSRNDKAHFNNLTQKFNDKNFGVDYYSKHNKWRNAELEFEGKIQGQIEVSWCKPYRSSGSGFISLSVKMPKEKMYLGRIIQPYCA